MRTTCEMFEICKARSGSRCHECICRKQCDIFRERHNGIKPCDYTRIMEAFKNGESHAEHRVP